jgi:hypothetical protein
MASQRAGVSVRQFPSLGFEAIVATGSAPALRTVVIPRFSEGNCLGLPPACYRKSGHAPISAIRPALAAAHAPPIGPRCANGKFAALQIRQFGKV